MMLFVAVGKKRKTHQLTHQVASSKSRSLVTSWLAREKRGKFTREKNEERGQKQSRERRVETGEKRQKRKQRTSESREQRGEGWQKRNV